MTTNETAPWKETHIATISGDLNGNITGKFKSTSVKSLLPENTEALKGEINSKSMLIKVLQNLLSNVFAAYPVISETAPENPIEGQVWFKPMGSTEDSSGH